jgi:hypothetical protein
MEQRNLLAKIFGTGRGYRWHCPSDAVLAAYVDNTLGDGDRARLQGHLSLCWHCRTLVADVVKLRRMADLPAVPAVLVDSARAFVPSANKPWAWGWATLATAGTLACTVIAVTLLKPPQSLRLPVWPAPAVPIVSEARASNPLKTPAQETVRKLKSPEYLPTVVYPHSDMVIAREHLELRWEEVPDSLYYRIRLLTSEGDLVWEGDSTATRMELPNRRALNAGKYFVLISAVMRNGRTRESNPVGFQVTESH